MQVQKGEKSFYIGDAHVFESLKGQGAGKQLLEALTGWAREEGLRIIPLCPYAKAQMEKNPAYHDLIHR